MNRAAATLFPVLLGTMVTSTAAAQTQTWMRTREHLLRVQLVDHRSSRRAVGLAAGRPVGLRPLRPVRAGRSVRPDRRRALERDPGRHAVT